jgi:hypothetical protein
MLFSACATVTITKVDDSTYMDGLRFYRPELFLLVTEDENGNFLKASVISLPDKTQEYVLRNTVGIGAVEASATLDGGWNLTALGASVDSKVPDMITALSGILPSPGTRLSTGSLKLGLYRIVFDRGKVSQLKKISSQ